MTEPEEEAAVDPVEHEARRTRGPRWVLRIGPVVAVVLSFASSAAGLDGRAGAFLLLLLLALTFGTAGLWLGAGLLLDEVRGLPTSRRRGVLAGVLFIASLLCMTGVGGISSGGAG